MSVTIEKRYYTPEEYLELEEQAEYKSEYRDGEIIPMTGETTEHNQIALNFYFNFRSAIKGKGYKTFMEGIRLWIPAYRIYTYPDVMVVRGRPIYEGNNRTMITNPCLIVEVLSKSTKNYARRRRTFGDRGDKFNYYRSIPELQEYILIEQYSYQIEQYIKQSENEWLFREYNGEGAILNISSMDFQIALQQIYEEVEFEIQEL